MASPAAPQKPLPTRAQSYAVKSGVDRTWLGNAQLAVQYVAANSRRAPRSLLVGIATVALVVGFAAMLQSIVQRSPLVFMRLQEDQSGDADMVLTPETSADNTSPFLNATEINQLLRDNPHVKGAAARWILLGSVLQQDNPDVNTSAWVLVIDSDAEEEIGLGRNWNRRRLGEQETYVTDTVLADLGVTANAGERVRLYIDPISIFAGLGLDDNGASLDLDDPLVAQDVLEGVGGVDLETSLTLDLDLIGAAVAQLFGTPPVSGLGTVPVDVSGVFQALYPTIRDALVIDQELIVVDGVGDPGGKWAPILGNVVVLEMDYVAQLIREALDAALATLETLQIGVLPGALAGSGSGAGGTDGLTQFLISARLFIDSISAETLAQNALLVNVQYTARSDAYMLDDVGLKERMVEFTNAVFDDLGDDYPAQPTLPLATALAGTLFIRLFLDQIFNAVVFLLGVLGVMVIYSLVIGDVEEKTYEYGMLRALGMRQGLLGRILGAQSVAFAVPGLVIGFLIASVLNVLVMWLLAGFLVIDLAEVPLGLHVSAVIYAIVLGTVMPALANIVPVRRALSKTLRDALDLYHQTSNDIQVSMLRLADIGLSPAQIALSAMLVLIGFVTYTLLPLAFIFRDFSLFLTILNGILLGMVLGLSLVSQAVQARLESLVLWLLLWGVDKRMNTVVRKNLAGHRHRNRKTSYMISISVAFLLFGGTMFALQATSIANTVQLIVGADVLVWSLSRNVPLPQADLTNVLEGFMDGSGGRDPIVEDFTFLTYQLQQANFVRRTRLSNLAAVPDPRSQVYGVQSNYQRVAFEKFFITSEVVDVEGDPDLTSEENELRNSDVFRQLYAGQGDLTLPIESTGLKIPPVVVSGSLSAALFVCNISTVPGVAPEDVWRPDGGINGQGGPSAAAYSAVLQAAADGLVSLYDFNAFQCAPACGVACTEVPSRNETKLAEVVSDSYSNYVDVIMSEATRVYVSTDTNTPLKLRVQAQDSDGNRRSSVYLAKARAMMAKAPGFFFSTYSQTALNAPVLLTMPVFGQQLLQAESDAAAALEESFVEDSGSGGGGPSGFANDTFVWVGSPSWTQTTDTNEMLDGGEWVSQGGPGEANEATDATLAFDGDPSTLLSWTTTTDSFVTIDLGSCLDVAGVRLFGSATVGDVRNWEVHASARSEGPWAVVHSGVAGTSTEGVRKAWDEALFAEPFSARYWRFVARDNYGWTGGTVLPELQLRLASLANGAPCDALVTELDETSLFVPKQRLLIKIREGTTAAERQRVLNALRNFITSDLIRVEDTTLLIESTETANLGLQVFFNVVAALCLILCFFASWMSFTANIRENSREFGILRALGFSVPQTLRVYIYESLSVVLTSFMLGTIIGLIIAISLTMQFNLFTEMPFELEFPTFLFVFMFVVSLIVAVLSSLWPARLLSAVQISDVVKGKSTLSS